MHHSHRIERHAWLRCGRAQGSKEDKAAQPQEDSFEEREHTRSAAGEGLEVAARRQRMAQEQVSMCPAPRNSQRMGASGCHFCYRLRPSYCYIIA